MEEVKRQRALAAVGVVLLASVLACATFWVGRGERWSIGKLDPMSSRLIDLSGSGDPAAVRVVELAIRRRPVAYAKAVFVALRERCTVRCDGIDGLLLAAFDRVAAAGQLRTVVQRGKWEPRFRRPELGRPLAMVRSRRGYYRFPVSREVTTVLLRAIGRASPRVRGIRDLVGLPEVRRALCSLGGSREADLRAGFCALAGMPGGDPSALCAAVAGGAGAGKLEKLTDRQQGSLRDLCASAGSAESSEAFAPTGLETLVGPGCVDMLEAAWGSGAAKETDADAALLGRSLECMGVKEEPTRPTGHGAPGRGSVAFYRSSDGAEGMPDPWRQPAEDERGWSYTFNVLDPEANAANAAHVGDRGFIAVFAVESSAEEGTIAIEIVATSNEGDIGAVIVETGVPLDTLDVFDATPVLAKVFEGMAIAAAQVTQDGYNGVSPPSEPAESPEDHDWEDTPEDSSAPTDSPEDSSDEKDGALSGPLGDPEACRDVEGMLLRGPSGEALRGDPGRTRPPSDPRASHPREEIEGGLERGCSAATAPRACGAVDCRTAAVLDAASCTCRTPGAGSRPSQASCSAARCPEGARAQAVGPICTCADSETGGFEKPQGPKPGVPLGALRRPEMEPR
ncbi:MAG: hypothetical protein U1E65_03535 [Myxococcota bacterium]